jgi:micrococcal nuclease
MTTEPHTTKAPLLAAILATLIGCDDGWHDVTLPTVPAPNESGQVEVKTAQRSADEPNEPATGEFTMTHVGQAVAITDGDSFRLLVGDERIRVHLDGIDCPELRGSQPYGNQATQALSDLILDKEVSVKSIGTDYYGRTLGRVFVDGVDVNRELVARGLAWHYVEYSDDESLAAAESEARATKAGLWGDPEPIPPWDWRRRK